MRWVSMLTDTQREHPSLTPGEIGEENTPSVPSPAWFWVQAALLVLGLAIFAGLLWLPTLGLHAVWNVLIPVAPLLFVFFPGLWRNICPLATFALLPRKLGFSVQRRMSSRTNQALRWGAVAALLLIVPLRHVILDVSGPATAGLLVMAAAVAFSMGCVFDWKSGWCSSLCPVQPVELLYGRRPLVEFQNPRCSSCVNCTQICNDSDPERARAVGDHGGMGPLEFLTAGFPGFIWAWFQVPNFRPEYSRLDHTLEAFGLPLLGFLLSALLYNLLRYRLLPNEGKALGRLFATVAVVVYYWYRLPFLVGFSPTAPDGMLVDLTQWLPGWAPYLMRALTSILLVLWLLPHERGQRPWLVRPPYSYERGTSAAHLPPT